MIASAFPLLKSNSNDDLSANLYQTLSTNLPLNRNSAGFNKGKLACLEVRVEVKIYVQLRPPRALDYLVKKDEKVCMTFAI